MRLLFDLRDNLDVQEIAVVVLAGGVDSAGAGGGGGGGGEV